MALWRHCCSFAIVAFAALAPGVAFSQQRGDPIGPLTRVATFDRAQQVNVGKTKAGKIACYFREEGSSHSLDIGMTADGAFIRLETFDSRETTPTPPLRVFAGKQMAKGEYATNEFAVLQAYDATFEFYVPKPSRVTLSLSPRATRSRSSRWWRAPGWNLSWCNPLPIGKT